MLTDSKKRWAIVITVFLSPLAAVAEPLTTAFTYQGQLKNGGGPAEGPHVMVFQLYDAAAGGDPVGAALVFDGVGGNAPPVQVTAGLFTVPLDFGAEALNGQRRWLEITVAGTPLTPRQEITAAPYAALALTASNATQLNNQPASFYQNAANLTGTLALSGNGPGSTIYGANSAADFLASGVTGNSFNSSGSTLGVFGLNSSSLGRGVLGWAIAGSGVNYGVQGQSDSTAGFGVFGVASASSGGTIGVYGRSDSTEGRGILGYATAPSGVTFGAQGQSSSTSGFGLLGAATASSGVTYGLFAHSNSTEGRGVLGRVVATSGVNYGVVGESSSPQGFGGKFTSPGIGLQAESTNDHAIVAITSGQVRAGIFALNAGNLGTAYGGRFEVVSSSGHGVYGLANAATGFTSGGRFLSASTDGRGVVGIATAETGITNGGRFENFSSDGRGVHGLAWSLTGTTYGVIGECRSPEGLGGFFTSPGVGLQAESSGNDAIVAAVASPNKSGIWARNTASTGSGAGVVGESAGTNGRGVVGLATAATGATNGGRFQSVSTSGAGVFGWASALSGTTYGVAGESNSSNLSAYGVWALGRLGASGTKSFRIDHPDDPENRYLLHYSTESPEVLNAYSGTISLDAAGEAIVEMPHYFTRINKDPRYTLTAVGAPMPNLHVAEEIDDAALMAGANAEPGAAAPFCWFRIAGGVPGKKVSWRVEAVRNDRWVRERGAPVEIEKEGLEKGTYQHPGLYGQPPEKGMNYEAQKARQADRSDTDFAQQTADFAHDRFGDLPGSKALAPLGAAEQVISADDDARILRPMQKE